VVRRLKQQQKDPRIPFEPFIGVGPRRFFDLFSVTHSTGYPLERKNKQGRILDWRPKRDSMPRVPMAPSSYLQREVLASRTVYSIFESKRK
jgi:hypothetical protein